MKSIPCRYVPRQSQQPAHPSILRSCCNKNYFFLFLRCRVTSRTLIGHSNHSIFSSRHSCLTFGNGYTDIHGTLRLRAQQSHSNRTTIGKECNYARLSLYPDLFFSLRVGGGRQDFSYETPKEHEDNAHIYNEEETRSGSKCAISPAHEFLSHKITHQSDTK